MLNVFSYHRNNSALKFVLSLSHSGSYVLIPNDAKSFVTNSIQFPTQQTNKCRLRKSSSHWLEFLCFGFMNLNVPHLSVFTKLLGYGRLVQATWVCVCVCCVCVCVGGGSGGGGVVIFLKDWYHVRLFSAGTMVRGSHHRKFPTRRE